jgi:hypothetical protein
MGICKELHDKIPKDRMAFAYDLHTLHGKASLTKDQMRTLQRKEQVLRGRSVAVLSRANIFQNWISVEG